MKARTAALPVANGNVVAAQAAGMTVLGLSVYAPNAVAFSLRDGSATGPVVYATAIAAGASDRVSIPGGIYCDGALVFHVESGSATGLIGSVWIN